jgi:CoA:oxalate CoA-transferase
MVLCDLGAEVIKIEMPGTGDDSRGYGPFIKNESAYFMSLNRGKKSLTLNLKKKQSRKILKDLVKISDVLVENFRPGTMEKFGVGYEVLRKINPRLIYASCSGFGCTGPYAQKPAYDITVQGMGGIMSITGEPDGPPVRVGTSIGDIAAGLFTAIGILSALYVREKTGRGQKIDVSMLDCQVAILENAIARYMASGIVPRPLGTRHPSITPFEAFESKDDYVIIAVGNDALWVRFCKVIGEPKLAFYPEFSTNTLRTENYSKLRPLIAKIIKTKTTGEWIKIFEEEGIPCAPINTVDKILEDPQIQSRRMIVELKHPKAGKLKVAGLPIKLSETPGSVENPAPLLGQHTEDILSNILKINFEKIQQLRKEQVI